MSRLSSLPSCSATTCKRVIDSTLRLGKGGRREEGRGERREEGGRGKRQGERERGEGEREGGRGGGESFQTG